MKLYRSYYTMISCSHLSTGITAIMGCFLSLVDQYPDILLIRMSIHMRTEFSLLFLIKVEVDHWACFFLMSKRRSTIILNCNYFFPSILEPFLKNVIRSFILNTKRLEGFYMRQSLSLVLKVKPFQFFTAIHNFINLVGSEVITFN